MKRNLRMVVVVGMAAGLLVLLAVPVVPSSEGVAETYIVLYGKQAAPRGAEKAIAAAGGELVYSYDEIGVAIARSGSAAFRDSMMRGKGVEGVVSTAGFGVKLDYEVEGFDAVSNDSSWGDPLSYLQWDMLQIHVPEAQAITTGSPAVVVGDIDTGIDANHPDLVANLLWPRACRASAAFRTRIPLPGLTTMGTGPTPRVQSPLPPTGSASSASPRMSRSPP